MYSVFKATKELHCTLRCSSGLRHSSGLHIVERWLSLLIRRQVMRALHEVFTRRAVTRPNDPSSRSSTSLNFIILYRSLSG